jgi:hypothetical protein
VGEICNTSKLVCQSSIQRRQLKLFIDLSGCLTFLIHSTNSFKVAKLLMNSLLCFIYILSLLAIANAALNCTDRSNCYHCLYQDPRPCSWCSDHCVASDLATSLCILPPSNASWPVVCPVREETIYLGVYVGICAPLVLISLIYAICHCSMRHHYSGSKQIYKCQRCDHSHHSYGCSTQVPLKTKTKCVSCKHNCHNKCSCSTEVSYKVDNWVMRDVQENEIIGYKTVQKSVRIPYTVTKNRQVQKTRYVTKSIPYSTWVYNYYNDGSGRNVTNYRNVSAS